MKDFFKHILTGADNASYDIGRVFGALCFLVGLGLEVYCVVSRTPFDFLTYGAGVAAMAVGVGAFLKIKETTEPKAGGQP
jgi:hypothetical protein